MILPLDQQVPTRETCERMKELGYSATLAVY